QSQLARLYLHAAQATGEPAYRRVVEETLDYVLREMTHPTGGFFSTQDADSEGEEGRFFLWDQAEGRAVLDPDAARAALLCVARRGGPTLGGGNILLRPPARGGGAGAPGQPPGRLEAVIADARTRLFAVRERRIKPGRGEKVLAGWNGMMLRALAEAAAA